MKVTISQEARAALLARHHENPRHDPKGCPVCKAAAEERHG